MTLTSIRPYLMQARQEKYAVPLFNVYDSQGVEGTLRALTEKRAPTIIAVYSPYAVAPEGPALAAYIRQRAAEVDVPVSLMLDHGASAEICIQVLDYGYTDVMYDGSKLPIEENIANTRKVVAAAHERGVMVEAELGHVGMGDQYDAFGSQRLGFTDPAMVDYFIEQTGIDALAIAFGNAHGFYKGEPHLDLELVAEIRSRVNLPLVMHGGTGISDDQFRAVVAAGISKVNFASAILATSVENMRKASAAPDATIFSIAEAERAAYHAWCTHLYDVFGTTGKA